MSRGRLLDVGCGPGTVARRPAPIFEAVAGLGRFRVVTFGASLHWMDNILHSWRPA